jgi:hypothetical protein
MKTYVFRPNEEHKSRKIKGIETHLFNQPVKFQQASKPLSNAGQHSLKVIITNEEKAESTILRSCCCEKQQTIM